MGSSPIVSTKHRLSWTPDAAAESLATVAPVGHQATFVAQVMDAIAAPV